MTKGWKWSGFSFGVLAMGFALSLAFPPEDTTTGDRLAGFGLVLAMTLVALGCLYTYGMLKGLKGIGADSYQGMLDVEQQNAEKRLRKKAEKYHISGADQGSPHEP